MYFYVFLWIISGVMSLFMNRFMIYEIERIFEHQTVFLNKYFFKNEVHKIFYGPIYLLSTFWNLIFNLDIFEKARMVKEKKDQNDKKVQDFVKQLTLLGKQMTDMYKQINVLEDMREDDNEENLKQKQKDTPNDVLRDVEDILRDLGNDEKEE